MSAKTELSAISSAKTGWRDPRRALPGIPLWVNTEKNGWIETKTGWRVAADGWVDEHGAAIEVTGWMPLPLPPVSAGRAA